MPWGVVEPKHLLEPEYDKHRDQIACVETADGRVEGFLVTYAEHVEQLVGLRGLRPRWRPTEVFKGWFMPTEGRANEVLDLTSAELDESRWGASRLRWLAGVERDAAWDKYLQEWGPHEASDLGDQES